MLVTLPVLQVNSLYDTRQRLFILAGWFKNDTLKRAQQLLTDARFMQIDANLRYFVDRYQVILDERDEDPRWTDIVHGRVAGGARGAAGYPPSAAGQLSDDGQDHEA